MISCVACTHFTLRERSNYDPVDMSVAGKRREWLERSKK